MTVDPTKLGDIIGAITKKHGKGSIRPGASFEPVPRISSSSLEMDFMMQGGFPIGRFSRLFGGYSSGKSLTCWGLIREAQKMGLTCAYYNIEKQYDPVFTAKQGVDLDALQLVDSTYIERVGESLEALLGVVHVHVLDSLSSAISVDEMETKVEEWRIGLKARAWAKVLSRALARLDDSPGGNTVIMVDQARDTFGMGEEHPPGGRFIEFTSSMSIHTKRGAFCWYDDDHILQSKLNSKTDTASELAEADGVEVQAKVYKSRVCRPRLSARLRLDYASMRFDSIYETMKLGIHFGVITKEGTGNWWLLPNGKKVNGKSQLYIALREDPDTQASVDQMVRMMWFK